MSASVTGRAFAAGRVLMSAVPLDNTWGTNLIDLPSFVPLAHELVYYLAGARSAEVNLTPGQPIRFRPGDETTSGVVVVQPPDGDPKTVEVKNWPLVYEDTGPELEWDVYYPDDSTVLRAAVHDSAKRRRRSARVVVYHSLPGWARRHERERSRGSMPRSPSRVQGRGSKAPGQSRARVRRRRRNRVA